MVARRDDQVVSRDDPAVLAALEEVNRLSVHLDQEVGAGTMAVDAADDLYERRTKEIAQAHGVPWKVLLRYTYHVEGKPAGE